MTSPRLRGMRNTSFTVCPKWRLDRLTKGSLFTCRRRTRRRFSRKRCRFGRRRNVLNWPDSRSQRCASERSVASESASIRACLDGETYVMLKARSEWREGVTARGRVDRSKPRRDGCQCDAARPCKTNRGRVVMCSPASRAPMEIRVYGDKLDTLARRRR